MACKPTHRQRYPIPHAVSLAVSTSMKSLPVGSVLPCYWSEWPCFSAGCARKPPEPAKTTPPVVTVTVPIERMVTDYEDFTGRTEPIRIVELKARVTGYLEHIYFRTARTSRRASHSSTSTAASTRPSTTGHLGTGQRRIRHFTTAEKNYKRERRPPQGGSGPRKRTTRQVGDLAEAEADIGTATAALELAEANLASPASPRRSMGDSASGWSIPATSSRPTKRP